MNNSFKALKNMWNGAAMAIGQGYREAVKTAQPSVADERHYKKGSIKARQAGKGTRGRHYIRAERQGPFHRQVGVRHLFNNEQEYVCTKAVVQTFYVLRTLHATKGWRSRTWPIRTSLV